MKKTKKKIAFVAMKFEGTANADTRYKHIRQPLLDAGFSVIRADEIKSSGKVVDEVCNYLKDADLVVIDSTGDSHNVSYEIGYCHGIDRPQDTTILIRERSDIPFNYRHFRHQIYESKRSIGKLIRGYLGVSEPIGLEWICQAATFELKKGAKISISHIKKAIREALKSLKFSGRAEFYISQGSVHFEENVFGTASRLRPVKSKHPELLIQSFSLRPLKNQTNRDRYDLHRDFMLLYAENLTKLNKNLDFVDALSDTGTLRSGKAHSTELASVDCKDGAIVTYINPDVNKLI